MTQRRQEYCYLRTKSGWLKLTADDHSLLSLDVIDQPIPGTPAVTYPHLKEAYRQVVEQIRGHRMRRLAPRGAPRSADVAFRNDISRALSNLGIERALGLAVADEPAQ